MTFATASTLRNEARINITPLVDVMLVLLVIFMIAAPMLSRAIPMDLPQPGKPQPPPETIALRIDAAGDVFWNGDPVPMSSLPGLMQTGLEREPRHPAILQIDANDDADYGVVAKVLAAANDAGMTRVGFVHR